MEESLPEGWVKSISKSTGKPYYFNESTKESSWEKPQGRASGNGGRGKPAADQVRASHILVKHRGSRRPASWREPNITRTPEEAMEIIKGYHQDILDKRNTFAEVARKYSDCSSAQKDGDLGPFKRGAMQKAFEDVAFGLEVNQLSPPFFSDSGVHIVLRTA